MDTEERGAFFAGVLVTLVAMTIVLSVVAGIRSDSTFSAGEAALSEAQIDYMLSRAVGNKIVLFATGSGRIVYYDGALFKEME